MTVVYGICVEPEGMELDRSEYHKKCPECEYEYGKCISYERNDGGSINRYNILTCDECGYRHNTGEL